MNISDMGFPIYLMVNEPLVGKRLVEGTNTKTKKDWAVFIKKIADEMYPDAEK